MTSKQQNPNELLRQETLEAMQISRQPFDSSHAKYSFYSDHETQQLLSLAKTNLQNNDGLLFISGSEGSGKARLIEQLIDKTNTDIQYFSIEGNESLNAYNIFAGMLEAFQQSVPNDMQHCLDQLGEQLTLLRDKNLLAVVLINDAHKAPLAELYQLVSGMLYMGSDNTHQSFTLVLSALPDFEQQLKVIVPADARLNNQILQLKPLDRQRAINYINHHLQQAGYYESNPLDDQHLDTIVSNSSGYAAQINTETVKQLNNLFSPVAATKKKHIPPALRSFGLTTLFSNNRFMLATIAAICLLLSLSLFQTSDDSQQKSKFEHSNPSNSAKGSTKHSKHPRLVLLSETPQEKSSIRAATSTPAIISTPTQSPKQRTKPIQVQTTAEKTTHGVTEPPKVKNTAQPTPIRPHNSNAEEKEAPSEVPSSISTTIKPPTKTSKTKPELKKNKQTTIAKVTAKPKSNPKINPLPKANKLKVIEDAVEPTPFLVEIPGTNFLAAETKKTTEKAITSTQKLESANWVLMQNPDQFTVQMIASSDKKELLSFLEKNKLPAPNSIFAFKRGEETWYALVHGIYEDLPNAQNAIKKMPKEIRTQHPWIRQFQRVHLTLKNTKS